MTAIRRITKSAWSSVLGKTPRESLSAYLVERALAALRKQLDEDAAYREWAQAEGTAAVSGHYARTTITSPFALELLKSQIYRTTLLLKARLEALGQDGLILDAGASDGLFLAMSGATNGVGLNILRACAARVKSEGFPAFCGDLEVLPLRPKSFDVVICCETLEHLPNPIRGLQELARICRRRALVTIPWLPGGNTRITGRFTEHPDDQHVFEFSRADFERILTHTDFEVADYTEVDVFPEQHVGPADRLLLRRFLYPSYFPKLQYFELAIREGRDR